MPEVITDNLDLWTSVLLTKSTAGRGSNGKLEAYGIKKLRELILELAVRGKLIPQDTNDEPASVLLERIAKEKARLVKEGEIKKEKALPDIGEDDKPFAIPPGWEWSRLGNLFDIQDSRRVPINSAERATRQGPFPYYGANGQVGFIDDYLFDGERILIAEDGGFFDDPIRGVAYVANGKFWVNNHAHVLECLCETNAKYWVSYLNRVDWAPLVRGMTRDKLNQAAMVQIVMAVPPLAEQHRIVAKVGELMALCDQLEHQQTHSIAAHQTLVETLLGTLTRVGSQQEFSAAWARIANHFDTLFTTEASIDQLKQTTLQLAVMGKLVRQDPNDEPASVLLKRIAEERERMVGGRGVRKERLLSDVSVDEIPFNVPKGWTWTRLGEIVFIKGGKRVSNGYQLLSTPTPYIYIRVSDMKDGSIDDSDLKYIDEEMYSKISQYIITKNDIYMTIVGATIGKCGLVPDKFDGMNLTENAARLSPVIASKDYLYKTLSTTFCQDQFIDKTKQVGVQKMALNRLASTLFPLPPLAEQHRIVAKVDELMALCDALNARIKDAHTTQIHLADAILEQAAC